MFGKYFVKGQWDWRLAASIIAMTFFGLVMVYSSSYFIMGYEYGDPQRLVIKEVAFIALGLGAMWVASHIDHRLIRKWAVPINIITIIFYGLLLTPLGTSIKGGLRWVSILRWAGIESLTIMPSEIAKFAGIVALAYVLTAKKHEKGSNAYRFLLFCPVFYIVATLLQPDLSTAIVIVVAYVATLFFAGLNVLYVLAAGGVGILSVIILILAEGYRMRRIQVFLDPFSDPLDKGYQTLQSLYAIASGGLRGVGLANGKQKMLYLPLSYNDYIFSIIAEELGFVRCIFLIFLLSVLVLSGLKVAANAPDRFSTFVAGGIISQIAIQSVMNMYVSVNMVPSTGIPFPIISYGGTSLVLTLIGLGVVLGISRHEDRKTPKAFDNVENKSYHSLERARR